MRGLRFAVGDEHRLILDDRDRVRAIEWNGRRYAFSAKAYPAVKTPAAAIGHITSSTTYPDGEIHYIAPGWRWN